MKQPSAIDIAALMKCALRHMKRFASFIRKANKHHGGTAAASFLPTGKYFISFVYQKVHGFEYTQFLSLVIEPKKHLVRRWVPKCKAFGSPSKQGAKRLYPVTPTRKRGSNLRLLPLFQLNPSYDGINPLSWMKSASQTKSPSADKSRI